MEIIQDYPFIFSDFTESENYFVNLLDNLRFGIYYCITHQIGECRRVWPVSVRSNPCRGEELASLFPARRAGPAMHL